MRILVQFASFHIYYITSRHVGYLFITLFSVMLGYIKSYRLHGTVGT